MKIKFKLNIFEDLQTFLILWITQTFSALGSSMTSFALIVWSYEQTGRALMTALLSVCSYAPYVIFSLFAGVLSDKWNKKAVMLVCDSIAALSTVAVLVLLISGRLEIWHLYVVNAVNGVMNTMQQPASEVAVSLITPKDKYQRASGMRAFSNSLITILTPVLAMAVMGFGGLGAVIFFDLFTFITAFIVLAFVIRIPEADVKERDKSESMIETALEGLAYLRKNRGIFDLILFLAAINLTFAMYQAALPAMVLSKAGGGERALGMVNTCVGLAHLAGSITVSLMPAPKSRVRTICNSLLFSMSTENLLLAVGNSLPVWCLGSILGWLSVPAMNANMEVLLRSHIPVEIQGRVYCTRNALQFFTLPVGYLLGGALIDHVCEPWMAKCGPDSLWVRVFGMGKGSGAALLLFALAALGTATCLYFRRDPRIWELEEEGGLDTRS